MTETQEQREARWAASRARQAAYRASPEAKQARSARIAAGLCVVDADHCVTHECEAGFDHYLATQPSHSAQGIATND